MTCSGACFLRLPSGVQLPQGQAFRGRHRRLPQGDSLWLGSVSRGCCYCHACHPGVVNVTHVTRVLLLSCMSPRCCHCHACHEGVVTVMHVTRVLSLSRMSPGCFYCHACHPGVVTVTHVTRVLSLSRMSPGCFYCHACPAGVVTVTHVTCNSLGPLKAHVLVVDFMLSVCLSSLRCSTHIQTTPRSRKTY